MLESTCGKKTAGDRREDLQAAGSGGLGAGVAEGSQTGASSNYSHGIAFVNFAQSDRSFDRGIG